VRSVSFEVALFGARSQGGAVLQGFLRLRFRLGFAKGAHPSLKRKRRKTTEPLCFFAITTQKSQLQIARAREEGI